MFDDHQGITGVMPYIAGIPTYTLFIYGGLLAGLLYFYIDGKKRKVKKQGVLEIVFAGIIFGTLGSKIPLLFESSNVITWITGKSIVGGLLGGMVGVIFVKRKLHIEAKMGNVIAPAVALGMGIGRIGCFLGGCCYGIVYKWGVDFGDGNLRIPTQLFEILFHLMAFMVLCYYKKRVKIDGILFKIYIIAYFSFRFIIEFVRENPKLWLNMSIYQHICILGIFYMSVKVYKEYRIYNKKNREALQ